MPKIFINPIYETTPFNDGCFELIAEIKEDCVIIYQGSFCKSQNLNDEFQIVQLPSYGDKTWRSVSLDATGDYIFLDCNTK